MGDSSASRDDAESVNEVTLPEDDWVEVEVNKAFSRFRTSSSLKLFVDVVYILYSSILNDALSLRCCSSSNLIYHNWGHHLLNFSICILA